jgi:hypothetical protein
MNTIISNQNQFYVYIYFFPEEKECVYEDFIFNSEPFYIGKGKGDRLFHHLQPHHLEKSHKKSQIIKDILLRGLKPLVIKYKEGLTSKDAYKLESKLIESIGTIYGGNGPLANKTINRDGLSFHREETKKKIGDASKGRKHKPETIEKLRISKLGKKNPMYKNGKYPKKPPTGLNRSSAKLGKKNPMYGKHLSKEEKEYYSTCSAKKKKYTILFVNTNETIEIENLRKYCRENNLNYRCARRVVYGERKKYKDMIIKEIL